MSNDLPGRDGSELLAPLDLAELPGGGTWDGSIAYLDRDGVLNIGSENYINSVDELVVLAGAGVAVAELRRAGYRICVVTNQSPVSRGLWSEGTLAEIHAELQERLLAEDEDAHLDLILYCPHLPWSGSLSRKPRPGMLQVGRQLLQAASSGHPLDDLVIGSSYHDLGLPEGQRSFIAGDRPCDHRAGTSHGIRVFMVDDRIGLAGVLGRILNDADIGDA